MSPILAHTATKLSHAKDRVVICGSHGGRFAGLAAAAAGVRAILLNDAGIGKDEAGIEGIALLGRHAIPAAALSHQSCRIGDADDAALNGVVSAVNPAAHALGVAVGMSALDAAAALDAAPENHASVVMDAEHRSTRPLGSRTLTLIDSVSLVSAEEDAGAIVVTASHGGLVGGDPASAGRAEAFIFVFNDAGIGRDDAGISRLPILQSRGIAAATVSHESARIGIAESTLNEGIISRANKRGEEIGLLPGTPLAAALRGLKE